MRTLGDMYPDMAQGAKNGLELAYDSLLKGENGITHRQKVMNKYLNIVDKPAVDGYDIITTIDVNMQDIAEKALVDQLKNLEAQSGVAVVMEVATGEVKANVNMTRASDGNYYEMRNLAISNLMEPGSTFKTASIMVAMEDKYITPDYVVDTGNGIVNMHGSNMKDWNWHHGGYGPLDVTHILEYSSNVGVSTIIDKFYGKEPQKFIYGLRRMDIDTPLHLGIAGEASPRILGPKERSYFARTTLPWMSIGYETMFPPIYILNFYNAIANNGVMVKPKFVKAIARDGDIVEEFETEVVNPKICSDTTLMYIREILKKVVSEGLAKQAGSKQFSVSGKTGTAQISQGKAGYKSGKTKYLVSFCGYFPSENPKYSCIVSIEGPNGYPSGGVQAGSVFSRIAERIYAKHLYKDLAEAKDSTAIFIPDVKNGDLKEAAFILQQLNIASNGSSIPQGKNPVWGKATHTANEAELKKMTTNKKLVPNEKGMGFDEPTMDAICGGVKKAHDLGVQIGIVVGGGNFWRGRSSGKMERTLADKIGMLATVMNALAVSDKLEQLGVPTEVFTSITMPQVAQPFTRKDALRAMDEGKIAVFGGGTGNPFFSTDTATALRAVEVSADVMFKATMVDGVYDKDPHKYPDAKKYDTLTFTKVLEDQLAVMDGTAATLCRDNKLPILVFDLADPDNIAKAVQGENVGTLVYEG